MYYHALLIPTIIVFVVCLFLSYKKNKKIRDRLLLIWGIAMILYYVYRMLFVFPDIPMVYDETSLFSLIFDIHF